ncbi:MAG: hypothetical protein FE78DRAFT_83592 [Acidomyces sp. 'richmondensis']|nr:MAG: hypothetical protein FE78DRAFT_83592 [Acidomyces sp. 'richmondensis']
MLAFRGLRGQALAYARIVCVVLPAFVIFGYNQSNIGGRLSHIEPIGMMVAIYTIGCLVGALACPQFGNRFGRRWTLVGSAVITTVGQVLQSSSFSLTRLIIGHIVSGIGVGNINSIVPVWQSECSPKNRGNNVVILGTFVATVKVSLASWINYGLGLIPGKAISWRIPLAIPLVFTSIQLATAFSFLEGPRWLVQNGRLEDATDAKAILENLHRDSERAMLAVAVKFSAQMTGTNAITYYAKTIFQKSLHFPSRQGAVLAAGILSWKIIASSFSLFTIDRVGRKPLFMVASRGMSLCMTCMAITASMIAHPAAGKAATIFLFLYFMFFPVGFLGANFLYATEIASQDLRLFNFVIAEITTICFAQIGYRTYIIYAVIAAFVLPLV